MSNDEKNHQFIVNIITNCETLEIISSTFGIKYPASTIPVFHIFECYVQRNNAYVSEKTSNFIIIK